MKREREKKKTGEENKKVKGNKTGEENMTAEGENGRGQQDMGGYKEKEEHDWERAQN